MKVNVIFEGNEETHEKCVNDFHSVYNRILTRVYEDMIKGLL